MKAEGKTGGEPGSFFQKVKSMGQGEPAKGGTQEVFLSEKKKTLTTLLLAL
jgi:hypothetical protein